MTASASEPGASDATDAAGTSSAAADRSAHPFAYTLLAFAVFGGVSGMWQVLLADLRTGVGLSTGALGTVLAAGFVGALPAMVVGGRLADRFGPRRLVVATGLLMAGALAGVSVVGSYWPLVGLSVVYFGASGSFDVGINAAAIDVEQSRDGDVLSYFHAGFSGGAALGALAAGLLLAGGVHFRRLYVGMALLWVGFGVLVAAGRILPGPAATPSAADGGPAGSPFAIGRSSSSPSSSVSPSSASRR